MKVLKNCLLEAFLYIHLKKFFSIFKILKQKKILFNFQKLKKNKQTVRLSLSISFLKTFA